MVKQKTRNNPTHIYVVSFKEPPREDTTSTKFYFCSLAAIFDVFSVEDIGCKVTRLWNIGVANGNPYNGRKCSITREPITRKRQKRPLSAKSS